MGNLIKLRNLERDEGSFCNILSSIPFSVRTVRMLNFNNILTIQGLLRFSEKEFLRLPKCGIKTLDEVKNCLKKMNFAFSPVEISKLSSYEWNTLGVLLNGIVLNEAKSKEVRK